jgi:hypothetical protein
MHHDDGRVKKAEKGSGRGDRKLTEALVPEDLDVTARDRPSLGYKSKSIIVS